MSTDSLTAGAESAELMKNDLSEPTRILIAEDSAPDAELAERQIRNTLGMCAFRRVETREDYVAALDTFQPDLIISDYSMPRFDGMTALKLALERVPHTPVIVWTGSTNEDTAVACMKAGATNYILKDRIKGLGPAVVRALEEKQIRLERKRTEEALRDSEARYRLLAENASDIIFTMDLDLRFTHISPSVARMRGYTAEEAMAQTIFEVLTPASLAVAMDVFQKVMETEAREPNNSPQTRTLALEEICKDGSTVWTETTFTFLRDAQGKPSGILGITRDITERKRAEQALRDSDTFSQALITHSPIGISVRSQTGQLLSANTAWKKIWAISESAVLEDTTRERQALTLNSRDDYLKPYHAELRRVYEQGGHLHLPELKIARPKPGGAEWVSQHFYAIQDRQGLVDRVIILTEDITERKRAEEQIRQRNTELTTLNQIGQTLNKLAASSEILETIFTMVGQVLDNRNLYIALCDENNQSISFPVYTINGKRRSVSGRPMSNGITEYVIRTDQPFLVKRDLPGALAERGISNIGTPAHSFLAVPMRSGKKVIGVLALQDYEKEDVYDEHHLELLTTIAAQATVALENARLYADAALRAQRQAALYQISTTLAQIHTASELCQAVANIMGKALNYSYSGILLVDPETGDRVLQGQHGWDDAPPNWRLRPGQGLCEVAILTRKTQYTPDVRSEPRYIAGRPGFLSEIDIPIQVGDTIFGVLVVEESRLDAFDAGNMTMLEAIATQLAIALENTRLLAETQRRTFELDALNQIAQAASRSLNLDDSLDAALDELTRVLSLPKAWIYLLDPKTNTLIVRAERGWNRTLTEHNVLPIGEGLCGNVAQDGQPRFLNIEGSDISTRDKLLESGYRSIAAIPLRTEGRINGVLGVASEKEDRFGQTEMRWLDAVGNSIASALENARLFAQTQQDLARTQALHELSTQILSAQTVAETGETIIKQIVRTAGIHSASIRLFDAQGQVTFQKGLAAQGDSYSHDPPRPNGATMRVFRTGEPVIVSELDAEKWLITPAAAALGIKSLIGLPLKVREHVLGVLFLHYPTARMFSPEEIRSFGIYANQAAMALERARLSEEQQASLAMTTHLYELSAQFTAATTVDETARLVIETVRAGFSGDACTIHLFEDAERDTADFRLSVGLSSSFHQTTRQRSGGLTARVRESKEPIVATGDDLHPNIRAEGIQTNIALPLPGEKGNIGALFVGYRQPRQFSERERNLLSLFANQAAIALRRARLHDETRQHAAHQSALNTIISAANQSGTNIKTVLETALDQTLNALGLQHGAVWLTASRYGEPISILRGLPTSETDAVNQLPPADQMDIPHTFIVNDPNTVPPPMARRMAYFGVHAAITVPLNVDGTRIGGISIASSEPRQWSKDDVRLVEAVGHHLAIVAERARLFREAHQRLSELEAVNKISTALRSATTLDEMLPRFLTETLNLLNTDTGFLSLYDRESGEIRRTVARGWVTELLSSSKHPTQGIIGYVCATGEIYQSRELKTDPHVTEAVRPRIHANWSGACLPIRAADDIIGAIMIMVPLPRQLVAEEIRLLTTLAEIAGNAIQRMHSHAQTEQHLQRLTALRTIDNAINASLDLRVTLNVLLGQITAQLGVDAASVLLLNPYTQTLEHAANRGFRSPRAEKMSLRLNEGLAGRAAMERRTISSTNLPVEGANHARAGLLAADSFITYFGTPLITKGTIKGVLEIFHRAPLAPNAEWVDFLETLAGQVAIAVDNAELFETLQRANSELGLAYDATIEGWSRALDLHDRETDGHTQRVTEMTVRLARTFAVSENHLIHIRRGALLHDIGKVAIPDNILLKPGPLTDEEWQVMRRHPEYARDLLASIAYLRPAIDIPYCHHEKWDGKGYPRGLKGEEIPLAARIFAVVDVWDALSSNRPYRNAWTAENTREYLRAQSNTHFDPHILNTFLEMLADGTQSASSA